MRTQLLCTFTRKAKLNEIVDIIVSCNDILYDKIYIFENKDDLINQTKYTKLAIFNSSI